MNPRSLGRSVRSIERRIGIVLIAGIAGLVFLISVGGFVFADRSNKAHYKSAAPTASTTTVVAKSTTTASVRSGIEGFGAVGLLLKQQDGTNVAKCALLAGTAEQQSKGLMGAKDLGGYDGMLFEFQNDSTATFYTPDVQFPLSIAFFDASGKYISSKDMPICKTEASSCPRYGATAAYRYALEVPDGQLDSVGAAPGSTLATSSSCA